MLLYAGFEVATSRLHITPRVLSSQEALQEMTDQKKQQMDEAKEDNH